MLLLKTATSAGHWWFMPVILATQETEIKRIEVQSQSGQIVLETLSQKSPSQERASEVPQGVGPELKGKGGRGKGEGERGERRGRREREKGKGKGKERKRKETNNIQTIFADHKKIKREIKDWGSS
jgi:hypothetical protein